MRRWQLGALACVLAVASACSRAPAGGRPVETGSGTATPTVPALTDAERLAALGRVWGFLKYHHPAIAAGELDWDQALVDSVPRVRQAADRAELTRVLVALVDRAGPVPSGEPAGTEDPVPALDWLNAEALDRALAERLRVIRAAPHTGRNHYIAQAAWVGNPIFPEERAYDDSAYPDEALRLLALFRFWNVINYFYPYRNQIDGDWNSVLEELVPRFVAAGDARAYHLLVAEMVARLGDGHGRVASGECAAAFGRRRSNVKLRRIEGKMVVVGPESDAAPTPPVQAGDVVVAVAGTATSELAAELARYLGASNDPARARIAGEHLQRSNDSEIELTIEREGAQQKALVPTYPFAELYGKASSEQPASWRLLDGGIGYVDMARFALADIEPAMTALASAPGIVFDMRAYPEFLLYALLPHLSAEPRPFAEFTTPNLARPGTFTRNQGPRVGGGRDSVYTGKVAVLVDESTMSRAEFFVMALQTVPGAVTIGSQTAGADGNVSELPLPGGITAWFTGLGVFYPDGGVTQRKGIRVDVEVHPTLRGVREGRDEVLERAVERIAKP